MKKFYAFFKRISFAAIAVSVISATVQAQPICGPIVEDFNNTAGSTAGFTGDFQHSNTTPDGYLVENQVVASGIYSITTPTYQLPAIASYVGYGFKIDGTERVARVDASITYISTLNNKMTTVFVAQFVPSYNPNSSTADVCRAVSLSDLPGFPAGGKYRFRFELTPNTGAGSVNQTITFDDFRTNGTLALAPLPVNFIGFEGKTVNNRVELTWKVAGEENVNRYELERSEDGRNFRTLATIERRGKDTYTYTDVKQSRNVYYRVKNIDNDGKFMYSTILRLADGNSEIMIKAFPQPVRNQLTLQHPAVEERALVTVRSADGRLVKSYTPARGALQTTVDMTGLQSGVYLLRYDTGNGQSETMKIVKQ